MGLDFAIVLEVAVRSFLAFSNVPEVAFFLILFLYGTVSLSILFIILGVLFLFSSEQRSGVFDDALGSDFRS